MSTIRTFNIGWLDYHDIDAEGEIVLTDEVVFHGRWDVTHAAIFVFEDKFYRVLYRVPGTEMQEGDTWEADIDGNVEAIQVRPVSETVVRFVDA